MKDYTLGVIYCKCSNAMRVGKTLKISQYTPVRKKCPNCKRLVKVYRVKTIKNARTGKKKKIYQRYANVS